jgi:ERCC4-type nuclease
MLLLDRRVGSGELKPYLQKLGLTVEVTTLEFGDACFEGKGPHGSILVGVERKKLHDILHCIDDARYAGHQRIGMQADYQVSVLIVEGLWRPHWPEGWLMEAYRGVNWGQSRPGGRRITYEKLRRYLFSVHLSGVMVLQTTSVEHTARDIHDLYHYFQKRWTDHRSMLETQKLQVPTLTQKPTLVRLWATDIDGVGTVKSQAAAKVFRTPYDLATSDEQDWMQIEGIGAPTARKIIQQIHGVKS